jgi:CHAT domain-containing protein/predicted negative regulator of RcsB-dependent stress response
MHGEFYKKGFHFILVLSLIFTFAGYVLGQDRQRNNSTELKEEILAVYKNKGEQGVRDFVKKQKDKISNNFIVHFAKAGRNERKEEWIKVCGIIAEEKKDEKTLADVLYQTGEYFRLIGDNKKAADWFDRALPIYLKLNDQVGQGNMYMSKGHISLRVGESLKALAMYNKAMSFFKKVGLLVGQGNVYKSKGHIYLIKGENSRALEMYDKALPFFEKVGDPLGQGNIFLRKGEIYFFRGDNSKAHEMYEKALPFFQKAKDLLGQGNIWKKKGDIYLRSGNNSKAQGLYDKALIFFKKARTLMGQGNVYKSKGDMYLRAGDKSKALEMYDKALPLFKKIGDPLGQGNVYQRMGQLYSINGKNQKALEQYDKALTFFKKARDPLGQGNIYRKKGDSYFLTGDNSKALEMYDKAMPFYKKAEDPLGQGSVYHRKAEICFLIGDNLKSIELLNNALTLYNNAGAIEAQSVALHRKARVLEKMGKKAEVINLVEKEIANREKVRAQTAFPEMRRTFMEKVYKYYVETVILMLGFKVYNKAFKYAELIKARIFMEQMTEGVVKLEKGLAPELKIKRDNLLAKLSRLSKEMHKSARKKGKKKLLELKQKYQNAENEFEELLVKIRFSNPMYALVRYPQPVSVQDLQKGVLKKGEILVRYLVSPEKLYVFLVSKKRFRVVPLEIKKEEIDGITERYLLAIKANNSNDMRRFGGLLYEKLFEPLKKRLKKAKDIIIIPDGNLATIPFETLIIDKKESGCPVFLLEKYRFKYIQSASILSVLRKHYQRNRETNNFIGFGDPVYNYKKFKQEKAMQAVLMKQNPKNGDEIREMYRSRYARAGGIMPRLQGSGEEVKAIATLFAKKSQKLAAHIRDKATEENAKVPDMKDFDYIHFACHGLLNDDFQCLVLSQDIPEAKDDGYFTLNEIMNCDYNAKLVVLSACQTGSGKMERAEGVTGLTRAVMYAGTPAVLASLWKVDDTATKELMVKFYKNMLEKNLDKAEALRQAKLELLKNKKYVSPLFWSAFVLYGE